VKHIERNIEVIAHFHAAGVPGRHEVFRGETNYPFVLERIEAMGYRGVLELEFSPSMAVRASGDLASRYAEGYLDRREVASQLQYCHYQPGSGAVQTAHDSRRNANWNPPPRRRNG